MQEFMGKWLELQEAVNNLMDSSKTSKQNEKENVGIK